MDTQPSPASVHQHAAPGPNFGAAAQFADTQPSPAPCTDMQRLAQTLAPPHKSLTRPRVPSTTLSVRCVRKTCCLHDTITPCMFKLAVVRSAGLSSCSVPFFVPCHPCFNPRTQMPRTRAPSRGATPHAAISARLNVQVPETGGPSRRPVRLPGRPYLSVAVRTPPDSGARSNPAAFCAAPAVGSSNVWKQRAGSNSGSPRAAAAAAGPPGPALRNFALPVLLSASGVGGCAACGSCVGEGVTPPPPPPLPLPPPPLPPRRYGVPDDDPAAAPAGPARRPGAPARRARSTLRWGHDVEGGRAGRCCTWAVARPTEAAAIAAAEPAAGAARRGPAMLCILITQHSRAISWLRESRRGAGA
eukprot:353510-Chlamydomonas_euryale.AAC.5